MPIDNPLLDLITNTDTSLNTRLAEDTANNLNAIFNEIDSSNTKEIGRIGLNDAFFNPIKTLAALNLTQKREAPLQEYVSPELQEAQYFQNIAANIVKVNPQVNRRTNLTKWELTPEIEDRFIDEKFGYDYRKGFDANQELYAQDYLENKIPLLSTFGRTLGRFVGTALTKAGSMITGVIDLPESIATYDDPNVMIHMGDNSISKFFAGLEENIKLDYIPVYQTATAKEAGFWWRTFNDPTFWSNDAADGAAFMASAFITAALTQKMGLTGEAGAVSRATNAITRGTGNILSKFPGAFRSLKVAEGAVGIDAVALAEAEQMTLQYQKLAASFARKADHLTISALNALGEANIEAKESYDKLVKELTDEGTSLPEAKRIAQNAYKGVFWTNMAILTVGNAMFETGLIKKGLNRFKGAKSVKAGGSGTAPIELVEETGEIIAKRNNLIKNTLGAEAGVGKMADRFLNSRSGYYAGKWTEGILKEGYFEENLQLATQRYYQNLNNIKNENVGILNSIRNYGDIVAQGLTQIKDATLGNDTEAATSIGLGGLIAIGGTTIIGSAGKEYTTRKQNTDKMIRSANEAVSSVYGDIYERDEDGKYVYATSEDKKQGKPKIDEEKFKSFLVEHSTTTSLLDFLPEEVLNGLTDEQRNSIPSKVLSDLNTKELYGKLIHQMMGIRGVDIEDLVEFKFDQYAKQGAEFLHKLGFGDNPTSAQEEFNSFKNDIRELAKNAKQLEESISSDIRFSPAKEDALSENSRRNWLGVSGLRQTALVQGIRDLNRQLNELGVEKTDPFLVSINKLLSQLKLNQQLINNPDADSATLSEAAKLQQDLLKQQKDFFEQNKTAFEPIDGSKSKYAKNENGYYFDTENEDKSLREEKRQKLQEAIAGVENTLKIETQKFYKYASKNGYAAYKEDVYSTEVAEQEEAEEASLNELQATTPTSSAATTVVEEQEEANPYLDYEEKNAGDFAKITDIALRSAKGATLTTEEQALIAEYPELVQTLTDNFVQKISDLRQKEIIALNDSIKNRIEKATERLENNRTLLQDLQQSLQEAQDNLTKEQKDLRSMGLTKTALKKVVKDTQTKVQQLEEQVKQDEELLKKLSEEETKVMELLQEDPNVIFTKLQMVESTSRERQRLEGLVQETKDNIGVVKKLLKGIIAAIKAKYNYLEGDLRAILAEAEKWADTPTEGLSAEAQANIAEIETFIADAAELKSENQRITDLRAYLTEIENQLAIIEAQEKGFKEETQALEAQLKDYVRTNLVKALRVNYQPSEYDKLLDNIFGGAIGRGTTFTQGELDKRKFEGEQDPYIKRLEEYFYTTIDPNYEDGNQQTNRHQRFLTRISQLSEAELDKILAKRGVKNKPNLVLIAVTQHNIKELGLEGLVNPKFFTDDINTTGIYTVYAIKQRVEGKDTYTLVDENLKRIKTLDGVPATPAQLSNIVFSQFRVREMSPEIKERYLSLYTEEQIEEVRAGALEFFEDLLENSKDTTYETKEKEVKVHIPSILADKNTYPFSVSKGIPNKLDTAEGTVTRNAFTETLITAEDINAETVVVPTQKGTTTTVVANPATYENGNRSLNTEQLTIGRPYIRTFNGIVEQHHYADNNVFSAEQIETIAEVLYQLSKQATEKLDAALVKLNKGKKLPAQGTPQYLMLMTQYAANTKDKKEAFNQDLIQYLKSVLYWNLPTEDSLQNVNNRQIWIRSGKIYLGNTAILDFTDPDSIKRSSELREWLSKYNHNIRVLNKNEKDAPFIEYFISDKGKLERRKWDTYNHYLLSKTNPDGSQRSMIPLTTSIITRDEMAEQPEYDGIYRPYSSKGLIIYSDDVETQEKDNKPSSTKKVVKEDTKKEGRRERRDPEDLAFLLGMTLKGISMAEAEIALNKKKGSTKAKDEDVTEDKEPTETKARPILGRNRKATKPSVMDEEVLEDTEDVPFQEEVKETKKGPGLNLMDILNMKSFSEDDTDLGDDLTDGKNLRIAGSTSGFNTENIEQAVAEVSRMLPQVPVELLQRAIEINATTSAWGQFTGKSILLYEGAEEGTLYHEAFEVVANSILTDREIGNLLKEFKSRKGTFVDRESGKIISFKEATDYQAKEQMAEEFRDFKLSGKMPESKVQLNFFQKLIKFLRELIFNLSDIESVFRKLDQGFYADKVLFQTPRYGTSNYRTKTNSHIPELYYNKFIRSFTAVMFRRIFLQDGSLAAIDEIDVNKNEIYTDVRKAVSKRYNNIRQNLIRTHERYSEAKNKANPTKDDKTIISTYEKTTVEYQKAAAVWAEITKNDDSWRAFVDDHSTFIRQFKINFDNTDISEDTTDSREEAKDNKNQRDYAVGTFEFDGKSSAPSSIKLLFASMVKTHFVKNELGENNKPIIDSTYTDDNPIFLEDLDNYDLLMKEVLNKFSGINNLEKIRIKMLEEIGIAGIENLSSQDATDIINNLSDKQATLYRLYERLFGNNVKVSTDAKFNLLIKFNNFMAKQMAKPNTMFLSPTGNVYYLSSFAKDLVYNLKRDVRNAIANKENNKLGTRSVTAEKDGKKVTEQVRYFVINNITDKAGKVIDVTKGKNATQLLTIIGLDKYFTPEVVKSLTDREYATYISQLKAIAEQINSMNVAKEIVALSPSGLGIDGRIANLTDLYLSKTSTDIDTTFFNINNKQRQNFVLNNYFSRVLSEINNVENLEEFYEKNPHYQDTFPSDSIVIKKFFNPDGSRSSYKLELGYTEGWKNEAEKEGHSISSLSMIDRFIVEFNSNLNGHYYTLIPADSETEWSLNIGNTIDYSQDFLENNYKTVLGILKQYLTTELKLALSEEGEELANLNIKNRFGRPIYKSLRFFDYILDDKALVKIYEKIDAGIPAADIVNSHKAAIETSIIKYIENKAQETIEQFKQNDIISVDETGISMYAIDDNFAKLNGLHTNPDGSYDLSESLLNNIFHYHATNFMIANIEMYKLFFGDPAQFKDAEKRIKSFLSPVEWSFFDETGEFNDHFNKERNKVFYENEEGEALEQEIPVEDMTYHEFSNEMNVLSIEDITTADPALYDMLKDLIHDAAVYNDINEADGQSFTDIASFRELMIKSGHRWTAAHEEQFQYEMAYARISLAKKGTYRGYLGNRELRDADRAIINKYDTPPSLVEFNIYKPVYAGTEASSKFRSYLLKTSVFPITYRAVEGTDYEDVYVKMLNGYDVDGKRAKINIIAVESANKVGLELNEEGAIPSMYDYSNASIVTTPTAATHPLVKLSYKHYGIQVETQGNKKGNTLGSQTTKIAKANFMYDGVPVDFSSRYMNEDGTFTIGETTGDIGVVLMHFDSLSEEEKRAQSPYYRNIKEHDESLVNLKDNLYHKMLYKFGAKEIVKTVNGVNTISYEFNNYAKLHEMILAELTRREIDENTVDSVQLADDLKSFKNSLETLPSYNLIRNIIYAIVDKAILSPKVNGKARIQLASSFFNKKGTRKAAYFDKATDTWVTLNNKAEYDEAKAANKKIVLTSNELAAYSYKEGDRVVSAMEVLLPDIYYKKVNQQRKMQGLPSLTREELLKHLQANPRLLEGIGFRIPTQASSSIEFFKIKGFLPETMGNAIVVPSMITAKAGSDFDVDKLNTYLNNWVLDENGLPVYETIKDDSNSTVEQRYNALYTTWRNKLAKIHELAKKDQVQLEKASSESIEKLFANIFKDAGASEDMTYEEEDFDNLLRDKNYTKLYRYYVDKAEEEEMLAPTMAEFAASPIHLQNSDTALQNVYFANIKRLVSDPKNFKYLMTPNSMDIIKANRDMIRKAQDPNYKGKEKLVKYDNLLSFAHLSKQRHFFIRGKQDVGVFAVATTNNVNSQLVGGVIDINLREVRAKDRNIIEVYNAGSSHLPFNLNKITINGKEYVSFTAESDPSNVSIADKIANYVNGAVDVAKDPIIIEMGMDSMFAGIYQFMERITDSETVALFMMQPAIREYLHQRLVNKSILPIKLSYSKTVAKVFAKFSAEEFKYDENFIVNKDDMKAAIRKYAENKALTPKESADQAQIFANFLKIELLQGHLLENIMASNHDTANFSNDYNVYYKQEKFANVQQGNFIKSFKNGKLVPLANAIMDFTFVGTDANRLDKVTKIFDNRVFSLKNPNTVTFLKNVVGQMVKQNPYLSNDKFNKIMRGREISIIDFLVNNSDYNNTVKFNELANEIMKPSDPNSLLIVHRDLMSQIKADASHPLKNNFFLQEFQVSQNPLDDIVTFELKNKYSNSDVYAKNRLTEALRELRDNPVSAQFYKRLTYASYLKNGIRFTRDGINNIIPNEDYAEMINTGLRNMNSVDHQMVEEAYIRRSMREEADQVLLKNYEYFNVLQDEDGVIYAKDSKYADDYVIWTTNKKGKVKFAIKDRHMIPKERDKFSHVIFIDSFNAQSFGKLRDYVIVPNVKPGMDIKKMKAARDWSFMEKILYKRVGLESNTLVTTSTEGRDKKTKLPVTYKKIAYKPVATWGSNELNEIRTLTKMDGEIIASASILKSNPTYEEMTDEEIINIVKGFTKRQIDVEELMPETNQQPASTEGNEFLKEILGESNTLEKLTQNEAQSENNFIPSQEIDDVLAQKEDESKKCNGS